MATVQTSAPACEPITLDEAKSHLRIETSDEDALIQSLILTSRLHIEVALGIALITQQWSCFFDRWPAALSARNTPMQPVGAVYSVPDSTARHYALTDVMALPLSPIKSVDAVRVYAQDGTFVTLPLNGFTFDLISRNPRVIRNQETTTPTPGRRLNGIEIAVTCGFGAQPSDIPAPIRQALLLLVAHWYEHRDPGEIGTPEARVPAAISSLLCPYHPVRL